MLLLCGRTYRAVQISSDATCMTSAFRRESLSAPLPSGAISSSATPQGRCSFFDIVVAVFLTILAVIVKLYGITKEFSHERTIDTFDSSLRSKEGCRVVLFCGEGAVFAARPRPLTYCCYVASTNVRMFHGDIPPAGKSSTFAPCRGFQGTPRLCSAGFCMPDTDATLDRKPRAAADSMVTGVGERILVIKAISILVLIG